ncbi:hypothetical protein GS421_04430 [Rhodococcus hoagii]|nr:hypothetical protein [Prescottella equi]
MVGEDPQEAHRFWKIVGAVAVVWIAFALIGALVKGLFGILVVSAIVFGLYMLFKAMSGSSERSETRGSSCRRRGVARPDRRRRGPAA